MHSGVSVKSPDNFTAAGFLYLSSCTEVRQYEYTDWFHVIHVI